MKIATIAGAVAIIALTSGGAWADPNPNSETTGNPGNGNQGCTLVVGGELKGPGAMMQELRDRTGAESGNPKHIVDFYGEWDNVGDLIASKCGADEPS